MPLPEPDLQALFTAKETEAMRLYGEGLGYYRIGLLLGVSNTTIRNRVLMARRKVAIARRGTE